MKRLTFQNSAAGLPAGLLSGLLSLLHVFPAFAADDFSFADSVKKFFDLRQTLAQEKVYLHTDKPAYGAGETIFLKGYLVDAVTHSPLVETNFIYVELFNRSDSLVVRKKFKRTHGRFIGSLDIPVLTPPGDYYLRSYTEWMRNASPDYFFYKPMQIGNAIVTDIVPEINYIVNEDGLRVMKIGFFNDSHEPYAGEKVQYTLTDKTGKVYRNRATKTNAEGVAYITLDERSKAADDPRLEIELDKSKYDYRRAFYLNPKADDFAVTFFPEGGRLMAGAAQVVAFKAQNEKGFGETVTGYVLNTRNDTVARIGTDHDGMGKFLLIANGGETYRAVVRSPAGISKEFPLPRTENSGYALAITQNGGKTFYKILSAGNAGISDTLYLLAHTRGRLIFTADIIPGKPAGAVADSIFPDGIAHFVLCDKNGIPLSERLAFFRNRQTVYCTVKSDKARYGPREQASLTINLKDENGNPVPGDFSISITDSSVKEDSTADNIVTSLLLTSDLKGYVDCPQYYFTDDPTVSMHRELLMLTHGWTRFNTAVLTELPKTELNFFKEAGQFITGHIENLLGGKAKRAQVIGAWRDSRDSTLRFSRTTADEKGNFILENLAFRDTARFMVQGRAKSNSDRVSVAVDTPAYPPATVAVCYRDRYKLLTDDYLERSREEYFNKGGFPVLSVREIIVTANKMFSVKKSMDSKIYTREEIKKDNVHSLYDALLKMPGVAWNPVMLGDPDAHEFLTYRQKVVVAYIVDDFSVPIEFLRNVDISCVESVELISDAQMASFSRMALDKEPRGGTVIYVRIYDRFRQLLKVSPGLTIFHLNGYNEAKEFYHPVYDTPAKKNVEKPDLRTTIYWNPALRPDSTGTVAIRYYTSDNPKDYRVEIEGIDSDGRPVHYSAAAAE